MSRISKWHCVCMFIRYEQTESSLNTAFSQTNRILYPQVHLYSWNKELFKISLFLKKKKLKRRKKEETNAHVSDVPPEQITGSTRKVNVKCWNERRNLLTKE